VILILIESHKSRALSLKTIVFHTTSVKSFLKLFEARIVIRFCGPYYARVLLLKFDSTNRRPSFIDLRKVFRVAHKILDVCCCHKVAFRKGFLHLQGCFVLLNIPKIFSCDKRLSYRLNRYLCWYRCRCLKVVRISETLEKEFLI
jgi:hypothetical protein